MCYEILRRTKTAFVIRYSHHYRVWSRLGTLPLALEGVREHKPHLILV